MKLDDVTRLVAGVPFMKPHQGKRIYEHILRTGARQILELGFAHGTSSCYIAAALDELDGDRKLITIDLPSARTRKPNIHEMLDRCGLAHLVEPIFTPTSYTWDLMKMLEESQQPRLDFVFIDGGHTWDPTGFAFMLVDRLIKPGGWVLFDDLNWTLAASPTLKDADWVLALPEEQRTTPQVRKVFELLVKTHPDYTDFLDEDGWGWARKRDTATRTYSTMATSGALA